MIKRLLAALALLTAVLPGAAAYADGGIPPVQRLGTGVPTSIAVSPDGKTLAVGSSIGVWLLDPATLKPYSFWDTGFWVKSVAYSPDGSYLKVDEPVLDANSGSRVAADVNSIQWLDHRCTPDGRLCAREISILNYGDTYLHISTQVIDRQTNITVKVFGAYVVDAAWSPDTKFVYVVNGTQIVAWKSANWQMAAIQDSFFTGQLEDVTWSADGRDVVSGSGVWDAVSAESIGDNGCGAPVVCVPRLVDSNGALLNLYAPSALGTRLLLPHQIAVTTQTINVDHNLLLTSGVDQAHYCPDSYNLNQCQWDSSTRLWNLRTLKQIAVLPPLFFTAVLSASGNIVVGRTRSSLEAWDWQHARQLWSIPETTDEPTHMYLYAYDISRYGGWPPYKLAVSPDDRYVAEYNPLYTGHDVFLINLDTGERAAVLAGHTDTVVNAAFSPDGSKLAGVSKDGTVLIWNVP